MASAIQTSTGNQTEPPKSEHKQALTHSGRASPCPRPSSCGSAHPPCTYHKQKIRIPGSINLTVEERTGSWRWSPYLLMVFLVIIFFTAANLGPLPFAFPMSSQTLTPAATSRSPRQAAGDGGGGGGGGGACV